MKKISKFLAIFLVMATLFSMCGMMAGAISSSSSKNDMLKYYEDCIVKTAKRGLIKVENTWKYTFKGDYSKLSPKDAEETKALNDEIYGDDIFNETLISYYYGTSDKDYYIDDQPDTVWMFSVKRRIQEFDLTFKSAKLTTASNGDVTIVFNLIEKWDDGENVITITTKTAKDGCLKYFATKQESEFIDYSVDGVEYPATDISEDIYKVKYKKIPVKSITLSETAVTMGYNEEYTIAVTVNPSDASFKDVYCDFNGEWVADYSVNDDGTITLYATEPGTSTLEVYSYDGNIKAECEVTVKFTFFQLIMKFFRDMFNSLFGFLMF